TWQVGDANGDGKADLFHVTTNPGEIITWLSKGDGSFATTSFESGGDRCLQGCGTWEKGDLDGDGKVDLLHISTNPGQVFTWRSNGDGSFAVGTYTSGGDQCLQDCGTWKPADTNGDGKVDLVHVTTNKGQIITWL